MSRAPVLAALAAVVLSAASAGAAVPTSSATVTETPTGPSTFHYALTLADNASSSTPIGTFWYAWVPGEDFMGTSPTGVTSPAGWTEIVTHAGAADGYAIQWKDTAGTADVAPGGTLGGFSYDSADAPSVEFGNSPFFSTTPTLTSFTYSGDAPFSGTGVRFVTSVVPEPALLGLAVPAILFLRRRGRFDRKVA